MAAVDFFLKFDGIDGDVTAAGHEKWIEIETFSWGVSNPVSRATGGAQAGKPQPADFTVTVPFSIASPQLFKKALDGDVLTAQIDAVKTDKGNPTTFLTYKLSDCLISSYSVSSGGDQPSEQLSLNFVKIEIDDMEQQSATGVISAGFDFVKFVSF